jgi:hypothetical protein
MRPQTKGTGSTDIFRVNAPQLRTIPVRVCIGRIMLELSRAAKRRRLERIVSAHARAKPIICDGDDHAGGEPNSPSDTVSHDND